MKKLVLTDEVTKDLQVIADCAERYMSHRVFSPIWERIIKQIIEDVQSETKE